MEKCYILFGSNMGDEDQIFAQACLYINNRCGHVVSVSAAYESEPWGFEDATPFFNQALEVSTDLAPLEVLDTIQQIEEELGRNRAAEQIERAASGARYVSRPIDIDLIFYGSECIDHERLQVPHPLMAEREFVLVPLNEIMRQFRHPKSGLTVGEMLAVLRNEQTTKNNA